MFHHTRGGGEQWCCADSTATRPRCCSCQLASHCFTVSDSEKSAEYFAREQRRGSRRPPATRQLRSVLAGSSSVPPVMAGQVPQVPPPDLLEPLGVKVVSALGSPGQETVTTRVLRRSCRRRRRAVTRARTLCSARTTSWPRTRPCCPRPPRPAPPRPPPSTSPPSTPRGGRTAAWAGRGRACSSARSLWRPHRPTPGGDRLVANIFIDIFYKYIINFIRGKERCPPTLPSARRGSPSSARPSARSTRRAGRRGTTARASRSSHS